MARLHIIQYRFGRGKRMMSLFLAVISVLLVAGCSTEPLGHPLNTKPVPANARVLDTCTSLGIMACNLMSAMSGDTAVERRPACLAYRDSNWKLVETCGSLPASQP